MNMKHYDLMIMGMGPAGLSAALYARRQGLDTIVFGDIPGGILYMLDNLTDFPGFPDGISGTQFGMLAFQQAQAQGAVFPMAKLEKLRFNDTLFTGTDTDERQYTAPAAIIATGRSPKKISKIKDNLKGVHFCSVCDGPLYRNQGAVLAVIGGDKIAAQHALTLSKVAAKVYLVCRDRAFEMPAIYESQLKEHPNIILMRETEMIGIKGSDQVEALIVTTKEGDKQEIAIDGVFQAAGWRPNTQALEIPVETASDGYLKTDKNLMTAHTGLFAAGDVRDTDMFGVLTACADGARAAQYVAEFLQQR
ncbi:NAD(P)/FAD-dependent oxidoreductase [Desulfococcaceae bacterium HSG9]|nr:NAD(P)/FAD-dependent oxidoreductase [Desulfococcaceae bacterium HSG9]